jgi:hypothetical protein
MQRVVFSVVPKPTNPRFGQVEWAVAEVYANSSLASEADRLARALIDLGAWEIEDDPLIEEVRLDELEEGHPARATFERALREGAALRIFEPPDRPWARLPPFSPMDRAAIVIIQEYDSGFLTADETAKALVDELERTGDALNIALDPKLRVAMEQEMRRRGGAA